MGLPLLAHTIMHSLNSKLISRTIVAQTLENMQL